MKTKHEEILARIFFYILLGLAGFFLLRTVISLLGPAPSSSAGRGADSGRGSKMVKDPVCGIYIPEERAITRRIGGEVHYFCSQQCADEFAAAHHPH